MRDLVRILEEYCAANNIEFKYGSESHLNLLQGDMDPEQIYLLLFPFNRRSIQGPGSLVVQGRRFIGRYFLLKGSNRANHYFNENDTDQASSKYTVNIEPLLEIDLGIQNALMCANLEIDLHECQDAVNVLDANKDGVWCSFNYVQRR